MSMNITKKAKITAITLIVFLALVVAGIIIPVFVLPYDSGILSSANLAGNLNFKGQMCETTDYIFKVEGNKIIRTDKNTKATELTIYESKSGEPTYLNPFDGWIWFIDGGKIYRLAYYGQVMQELSIPNGATQMSVNGSWIYFVDTKDSKVYKIRDNGENLKPVTNIPVLSYSCDNRKILFLDNQNNLHCASTDSSDDKILDTNVSLFTYTLDELYYLKNGEILHIPTLVTNYDPGLVYTPVKADVFNFTTNKADGRGRLFFAKDNILYVKQLATENNNTEQTAILDVNAGKIDIIYCIDGKVYYGTKENLKEFDADEFIEKWNNTDTATPTNK